MTGLPAAFSKKSSDKRKYGRKRATKYQFMSFPEEIGKTIGATISQRQRCFITNTPISNPDGASGGMPPNNLAN